jgi:hypothetical protein
MLEKLIATAQFGALPAALFLASGPPNPGSWWYPDPRRLDYVFKLYLYAMLESNLPRRRIGRLAVRSFAVALFVISMYEVWDKA